MKSDPRPGVPVPRGQLIWRSGPARRGSSGISGWRSLCTALGTRVRSTRRLPGTAVPLPAYTPGDLPVGYYSLQQLRTLPSYLPTGGTHPIQCQHGWYPSPIGLHTCSSAF
ncbi:hypothetical protein CapIbe_000647 [Capra ibex]